MGKRVPKEPSTALTKEKVNKLGEQEKIAYREEQKRKREELAEKTDVLFKPKPSKRSNAGLSNDLLSTFLEKSIVVQQTMPPREFTNKNPNDEKYQRFVKMSYNMNGEIPVPTWEEIERIDTLKKQYTELKTADDEPEDYYERCEFLLTQINDIEPRLKEQMILVSEATSHFHTATQMRKYCKDNDDLSGMKLWGEIAKALTCLGIEDLIATEKDRRWARSEELAKAKAAELEKAREDLAAKEAAASESMTDDDSSELDTVMIKDKDGKEVALDSVLESGKKSARDRACKAKKKSVCKKASHRRGSLVTTHKPLIMTEKEFAAWILKPWQRKNQKTKAIRSGLNKKNHGLILQKTAKGESVVVCTFCKGGSVLAEKFSQHLATDSHWQAHEKLLKESNVMVTPTSKEADESLDDAYKRMKEESITEMRETQVKEGLAGSSLTRAETTYQVEVLEHACAANITMGQLNKFKGALDAKGHSNLSIGNARDLFRTVGPALKSAQKKKIKWLIEECYPFFGTITDGSPLGFNAEALMLCMVRKNNHQVIDVLISLAMYESSLKGEHLAAKVMSELKAYDMSLEHWRPSMMDRCATNGKSHSEILRITTYKPVVFPCMSHTFCLPGKEFSKSCSIMDNFRKAYNSSIKFRGKLFQWIKNLYGGIAIKVAGGVRWYLEWEQIAQMDAMGVDRIARDIVAKAENMKVCPKSCAKMKNWSAAELLLCLKVEIGAITEVGRQFCIATYAAEGNDPLVLGIYCTFAALDEYVAGGLAFGENSLTLKRCKEAAAIVDEKLKVLQQSVSTSSEEIEMIEIDIAILEEELAAFDERMVAQQETTQQEMGRGRRQRYANVRHRVYQEDEDNGIDEPEIAVDERSETIESLKVKRDELKAATDRLAAANSASYGNVITEDDFVQYAREKMKPAFDKYESLFENDQDLKRCRKAFLACKLFDVLYLRSGPSHESLGCMIDDLKCFDFVEFDENFLTQMKREIPELLHLAASMPYNFEGEDATKEKRLFHACVKERARNDQQRATLFNVDAYLREAENEGINITEAAGEGDGFTGVEAAILAAAEDADIGDDNFHFSDWKQDVGERSRRVYEWWRVVMNEKKGLQFFQKAVRLIVTVQVSSAAVERVFSQLTFIRRAIGDKATRDVLETRAFIRCNGNLVEDYSANGV